MKKEIFYTGLVAVNAWMLGAKFSSRVRGVLLSYRALKTATIIYDVIAIPIVIRDLHQRYPESNVLKALNAMYAQPVFWVVNRGERIVKQRDPVIYANADKLQKLYYHLFSKYLPKNRDHGLQHEVTMHSHSIAMARLPALWKPPQKQVVSENNIHKLSDPEPAPLSMPEWKYVEGPVGMGHILTDRGLRPLAQLTLGINAQTGEIMASLGHKKPLPLGSTPIKERLLIYGYPLLVEGKKVAGRFEMPRSDQMTWKEAIQAPTSATGAFSEKVQKVLSDSLVEFYKLIQDPAEREVKHGESVPLTLKLRKPEKSPYQSNLPI